MKKLFNILLPFALLSFSSVIHAEDDASGIVVSQSISNTPDANGQYSVTMEAYVKGESDTQNNVKENVDVAIVLDLSSNRQQIESTTDYEYTQITEIKLSDYVTIDPNPSLSYGDKMKDRDGKCSFLLNYSDNYTYSYKKLSNLFYKVGNTYYYVYVILNHSSGKIYLYYNDDIKQYHFGNLIESDNNGLDSKNYTSSTIFGVNSALYMLGPKITYSPSLDILNLAKTFVNSISQNATTNSLSHKVCIVAFSCSDTGNDVTYKSFTSATDASLTSYINNLSVNGDDANPYPANGLTQVNTLLNENGIKNDGNKKIVVLITDAFVKSGFDDSRANAAVTLSKSIKDGSTKVYVFCTATSLSDNSKKYMNAVSSNYPSASSYSSANTSITGFTSISSSVPIDFYPTKNVTIWSPLFYTLGSSSTISATFDGFVIPSGATITKQTADCTSYSEESGTATFGSATTTSTVSATRSDDGSTITISGFDFSGNFCGGPDGDSNYMGKKLIVTFPVVPCYNSAVNLNNAHSFITSSSVKNNSSTAVKSGIFTKSGQLPNLTITAEGNGVKQTDSFIFTVTGPTQLPATSQKTFKVMIHGTNSVTLKAIPAGTYTVQALDWPWTYTIDNGNKSVTSTMNLSSSSPATASVTFTFTPKSITTPHHGEATASTPAN